MSRRQCCCGGTGEGIPLVTCPNKPTGFNAREYRLNLPELRPLILGRVIPGIPVDIKDQGIWAGNASHPGWDISYCDYHTDPYLYYKKQEFPTCISTGNFWHVAVGPATQYMPSFGMIFDGADLVDGIVGATMTKFFSTSTTSPNASWSLRVYMERCSARAECPNGPIYSNRTFLQLLFSTRTKYDIRLCEPNGPLVTRNLVTEYEAQYMTDAWTAADGIGSTFYLKTLIHPFPLYEPCDTADGYWEKSACPQSFQKGTLTNYPIDIVPTEITMDRLS